MVAGCRVARYSERVQDRGRFMKALEDSLARLRTTAEFWQSHIRDVLARPEWRGSGYAASAGRNRAIAAKSGVQRNLGRERNNRQHCYGNLGRERNKRQLC